MKIIFEEKDYRRFEAEVTDYEGILDAVRDGMIAMSYNKETAEQLKEELKNE